jgi:hypothetical protein
VEVGVNYPWLDYGWDFGAAPPSWRSGRTVPRWFDIIDAHLDYFADLGISVVRWFILADGLAYGTGPTAPVPDPADPARWSFEPPAIEEAFLEHYAALLYRFAEAGGRGPRPLRLLPVFIDFHFCHPGTLPVEVRSDESSRVSLDPGWIKGGRAQAIVDAPARRRFLEGSLAPLLDVSRAYPDVIYAWELINEPDWVTRGWSLNPLRRAPVPRAAMQAFLEEGRDLVQAFGFRSTIGFASSRTLRAASIQVDIPQFHHYPDGGRRLDDHTRVPGIIGEFATTATDIWPDLRDADQTLLSRLRLAESRGYPLAIPWSFHGADRHSAWSADVEADLRRFTARSA